MSVVRIASVFAISLGLALPAAAALPLVSTPVNLLSTDIGTSFTVNYNGFINETLQAGLTARTVFRLSAVSANLKSWTFAVDEAANTSSGPITGSRVSIFGFNTTAELSGATGSGTFSVIGRNATVPQFGGGNPFDVCFRAGGGGNGCSSGGGGGVTIGAVYTGGSFVLQFANAVNSLQLDNFFVRYQSIAGGTGGDSGVGAAIPGNGAVPEPASWAMLIAGFGLVGAVARRRRGRVVAA